MTKNTRIVLPRYRHQSRADAWRMGVVVSVGRAHTPGTRRLLTSALNSGSRSAGSLPVHRLPALRTEEGESMETIDNKGRTSCPTQLPLR